MGKQLYFQEMKSDVGNVLSEFLHSENLAFLFVSLYIKVIKIIPDVGIRGIPGQIFGVSGKKERCLFYVTSSPDQSFNIHFKGHSGEMTFSEENEEKMAELALREAQRRKQNPRDCQVDGLQSRNDPKIPAPAPCTSNNRQTRDDIPDKLLAESADNEINNNKSASIPAKSELPETDQAAHKKHIDINKVYTDSFTDIEIECQDCGELFVFTTGEQKYYYEEVFDLE